ncbi:MAG: winged helix DNA-binding protein [Sphingomonadales bacterium]|nr:winged helix DNA-binding protein [Sphingomonadales bacterium]
MTAEEGTTPRERLLRRVDHMRSGPIEAAPLAWPDIAFLVHGMAMASGPVQHATDSVTSRHDLGPRGTSIINLIAIGIKHPHELAEIMQIGRSLVSAELARLTEAGLIVSRQGEQDRRRSELTLTPVGEAVLDEIRFALSRLVTESLGHYRPEELRLCSRILSDIQESIRGR